MYTKYIDSLSLWSDNAETEYIMGIKRTCYNGVYPFKIFPEKGLKEIEFHPITIFYGGNGSGKTTLLNIIAEKLQIRRNSLFSSSAFFDDYVKHCEICGKHVPEESRILTSDDVFDYLIKARAKNNSIDVRRAELFKEHTERKYGGSSRLSSLSEFDEWEENRQARKKTQSQFVRERIQANVEMFSNGESALKYFLDNVTENALYLLDEPENSLSIEFQIELSNYIEASASHYGCQFILSTHSPVLLSMKNAVIYDLDSYPVETRSWTELDNVRRYFNFFEEHKDEFI